MGPILKNLRLELCLILGIMFIAIICGSQDGKNIITTIASGDIGDIIAAIGAVWMVGAIFRLYKEISHKIISFFCALFVFLLGHSISEYGIFSAFIFMGSIALFIAYMTNPVIPHVAKTLFCTGLVLLFFGFSNKGCDKPTNPEKYHQPVTYENSKWDLKLLYDDKNGIEQYKGISALTGTEEQAYKASKNIVAKWKENNKGTCLKEVQVNLDYSSCPEEHRENYCPTHSLSKKYPRDRWAKWASFALLLDTK